MRTSDNKSNSKSLRQKAEKLMENGKPEINSQLSEADSLKLIHELQVHQIELELQNEELELAKKQAEEASEKYTELYDFSPTAYFTLSKNTEIIELNLTGAVMLGKERSKLIGNNLGLFIADESRSMFFDFIEEIFESSETKTCEVNFSINKDLEYTVLLKGIAVGNENQCFISVIDITQRKRMELELLKEKEHAEENDLLKTAFLQNMSHEIRTPMNAIKGFSSLLEKNQNNPLKLQKFTKIINQRCDDLLCIIDDILDIAKIESGQLPVHLEECDLFELFDDLNNQFIEYQERLKKQHIDFRIHPFSNPEGFVIITDKVKLEQILVNLITNAFKFTQKGQIECGCEIVNNKLLFYVLDTGIGIPVDKQKAIFERFTQLWYVENPSIGGNGLGLSIVEGLVKILGGEIMLESEPDHGSKFSFAIPYKFQHASPKTSGATEIPESYHFANKTILIVEDEIYNQEFLEEILTDTTSNLLFALTGKEAIQIATNQSVDLVLMDIGLPDMDGYQVFQQIRKVKPKIKIIAQTAYAADNDRKKALELGFNDYISKPFDIDLLLSLIYKHLRSKS